MKIFRLVLYLLVVGFGMGCGKIRPYPGEIPPGYKMAGDNSIIEISLSDGTRCVVVDGYQSSAISCDWK